jgi:hypothetical protein
MRVSTIQRQLGHSNFFGDPGELKQPPQWTADWVRHRLVEAFTIERRIPDKRIGPAIVKGAWASIPTTDSFADRVDQGEAARQHVWDEWARASGALPYEVSRMEEALSWPGQVLSNGLQSKAGCCSRGRSAARMANLCARCYASVDGRGRLSIAASIPAQIGSLAISTHAASWCVRPSVRRIPGTGRVKMFLLVLRCMPVPIPERSASP